MRHSQSQEACAGQAHEVATGQGTICGAERPTSGNYFLGGKNVSDLEDTHLSLMRGARIGSVFQSFNLINQFNVIDNIGVPMYCQGRSERQIAERAKELGEMLFKKYHEKEALPLGHGRLGSQGTSLEDFFQAAESL